MRFWQRLRRAARAFNPPKPNLEFDAELVDVLYDLAAQEKRPLQELAADLIRMGLAQRAANDLNWNCWLQLTPREQEVAALVCQSLTNAQIARHLVVSEETVRSHVSNLLAKFGMRSRADLRQALSNWDFSQFLDEKTGRR